MSKHFRFLLPLVALASVPAARALDLTPEQQRRVTPVVRVVQQNRDAVVNVAATHVVDVRGGVFDFFDTRRLKTNSVGSGAVIHPSGYVLTNAHVVAQATELKVIFANGDELPAEIVASLPEEDLAVLRVHPKAPLQAIRLGTSADLMVGESVIAIGNPVGLQHSVTTGIVSALGRELPLNDEVRFKDIIQTDAAINPGNSGGPLLNILGEQIGVNTAIRGDAQNVGFAIPVDRVKLLLPELLGVTTRGRVSLGIVWGLEVDQPVGGVRIQRIEPDTPAQRARLRAGQIVTRVAGRPVHGLIDVLVATLEQPTGRPFSLTVVDGATTRDVQVTIEELPTPDGAALARARFGFVLEPLDEARARRLGLRRGSALEVTSVLRNSPAVHAAIEPGDLVIQVGRYGVRDLDTLGLVLENVAPGDRVPVTIVRLRNRTVYRSTVTLVAR